MNKTMVFFDCWDTLIRFQEKDERWTVLPLYDHCINKDEVDWDKVYAFALEFADKYYASHSLYEITSYAFFKLVITLFSIKLDCPIEVADSETLHYLCPRPVDGIDDFLTFLEKKQIRYACLSNTIYTEADTRKEILSQIKGHHFEFVLASSDIAVKKPNPYFFLSGLKIANVKPENAIYIGDAYLQDAFGSFNAGFKKSYWLNYKNNKPYILPDFPARKERKFMEVKSYDEIKQDLIKELGI